MLEPVNYNSLNRFSPLSMALHKLRHFYREVWGAPLTPMEVIALAKDHAFVDKRDIERCEARKEEGDCRAYWTYMRLTGPQIAFLKTKKHNEVAFRRTL